MFLNDAFKICIQACINLYDGHYGKVEKVFEVVMNFNEGHVQGQVGILNGNIYICFPGTKGKKDWRDNFKVWFKKFKKSYRKKHKIRSGVKIHAGFYEQFKAVKPKIQDIVELIIADGKVDRKFRIICSGHSLGASLATLTAWHLSKYYKPHKILCITFGGPKVGNRGFAKQFNKDVPFSYRLVYGMDTVCGVPPVWLSYWHIEKMYRVKMPWYDILLFPILIFTGFPWDHYPQLYQKAIEKKY